MLPSLNASASQFTRTLNTASFGFSLPGLNPNGQIIGPFHALDMRGSAVAPLFNFGAYARYRAGKTAVVASPTTTPTVAKPTTDQLEKPGALVEPGADKPTDTPVDKPVVATPKTTTTTAAQPQEEQLSDAEIARLLEWARRTAEGGRIVAPPGDNLKELLDRIEKASPGNAGAAELRTKASAVIGQRGKLALKKMQLEEAEDAFRALIALRADDEWAKGRLARTLALRADRSLEKRRYSAAATDANLALELQPDDILARMVLAEAYLATGKRELATEEFGRVLELRPNDKRAKKGLAAAAAPPPKRGKPANKKKR